METSTPNPIFNPSHSSTKTSAFYLPNSYNQKTSHTSNTSLSRQTTKCFTYNNQINHNNRINYNNQIDYNYQITSTKSFNSRLTYCKKRTPMPLKKPEIVFQGYRDPDMATD